MGPPASVKAAEGERNIQLALAGLKDGTYSSIGDAHKELGVATSTLDRRVKGGKSRAQGKENQQLLTMPEEEALAAWISRATATAIYRRLYKVHSCLSIEEEDIRQCVGEISGVQARSREATGQKHQTPQNGWRRRI